MNRFFEGTIKLAKLLINLTKNKTNINIIRAETRDKTRKEIF